MGSIRVGGFAIYNFEIVRNQTYHVNDIVYSKPKARIGLFEKICIKKVIYSDKKWDQLCRFCIYAPLYVDTLNAYHNEEDLVTFNEAAELIYDYKILYAAAIEDLQFN